MRNKRGLSNILSTDRKALYMVLSIIMVSVLTLTVVYAALSTTLNINGQAEVSAASWDIYLDNVILNNQSATTTAPTITDSKTATFSTTLTTPGDFYEFTIDVVNNGSIDAMIDSVTKTPELSDTQKKYLNYIVEYQNGEAITTKQLVSKNSYVRLLVKVEFRKDISASDLPTTSETLDLAFTVNYIQADETGTSVKDDGVYMDPYAVGNEKCYGEECFYVISSDEDSVTMLAKYNLYVGGRYNTGYVSYGTKATGIQEPTMMGLKTGYETHGVLEFSLSNYWHDGYSLISKYGTSYPAYVLDTSSKLYNYVLNYKSYLEEKNVLLEEARLIKMDELEALGCNPSGNTCVDAPEWVYFTSYWTGMARGSSAVWYVSSSNGLYNNNFSDKYMNGIRPVIVVSKEFF